MMFICNECDGLLELPIYLQRTWGNSVRGFTQFVSEVFAGLPGIVPPAIKVAGKTTLKQMF